MGGAGREPDGRPGPDDERQLGIAAGRSLPEVCRDRFPFRVVVVLWLQAEAVAMATDLAEFVGAALGLHLVFGLSLWLSAALTGVAAFTILGMQVWGFRRSRPR